MNTTTISRIITPAVATAAIGLGFLPGLGGVHGAAAGEVATESLTVAHEGFNAQAGNVEFEWKVEEGESAPPAAVDDLATDVPDTSIRGRVTGWFPRETFPRQRSHDVNIGVGELQECTISKSMDATEPAPGQLATQEQDNAAQGGNVEFEWKVEEGES